MVNRFKPDHSPLAIRALPSAIFPFVRHFRRFEVFISGEIHRFRKQDVLKKYLLAARHK